MEAESPIKIKCISFGHKYGDIENCDFLFDARHLPNPFYTEDLREKTGFDKSVRDYVMQSDAGRQYLENIANLLIPLIPKYAEKGVKNLTVAFGCTGGKHRSVTLALCLAEILHNAGYDVYTEHRDIHKK